jgi:hypothetical protein
VGQTICIDDANTASEVSTCTNAMVRPVDAFLPRYKKPHGIDILQLYS